MEPHKVFVGQRVQLPEWHGTPDQLIEPPMVEEISTEHRAFSTHTLAKVVWSVRELDLEITESVVMENAASTLTMLQKLKDLGVNIAIDDFGTGYSSLSYLRRFPVDFLKIDRSLIQGLGQNPRDEAIVSAVITLAHSLDERVVAEGVETERQLDCLREIGCDFAQGYYFAKTLPANEVGTLLGNGGSGA